MSEATFGSRVRTRLSAPAAGRDAVQRTWGWWLLIVAAVLLVPAMGTDFVYFTAGMVGVYVLAGVGLNLVYGIAGQVSLGHGALVGVGAYVAGILMMKSGWGLVPSIVAAAAAGGGTGALIGIPALRLSTWYFALITLAFTEVFTGLVTHFKDLTGGHSGLVGIPPLATSSELFWIIVICNVIGLVLYGTMVHSRMGRGLVAIRDRGEAGAVSGVASNGLKFAAFAVSGAFAGAAGALYAAEQQVLTPEQFGATLSIFFIVVVVAGGTGRWLGPVIGTLAFFAIPELLTSLAEWRIIIYGVALLAFMAFAPHGVMGGIESGWSWLRMRGRTHSVSGEEFPEVDLTAEKTAEGIRSAVASRDAGGTATGLQVQDAQISFGGIAALGGVSLRASPGEVVGLVGPNGSGKTTLLNVITGIYVPDGGSVTLDGTAITAQRPFRIARAGIARTFQTPRLLEDLTVMQNVLLGAHASESATSLEVVARLPRARRDARTLFRRAEHLLESLGLDLPHDTTPDEIPHGQQRLIEVARALMAQPRVLLLDEPAAGLSEEELGRLDVAVGALREAGLAILLVEHHIGWVRLIADTVTVLDQGQTISHGDPESVFSDAVVRETYLGVTG